MFSDQLALQIAKFAGANGIPKSAMLADVEVETAGKPFEDDGRTPALLFERHIFYHQLATRAPAKLGQAVKLGLAHPTWQPKTATDKGQYFDQRNSDERMALLGRARAVDEDCALRSCSWGLPQIMGNECAEVGFATAKAMVDAMIAGGVPAHLEIMATFLKSRGLVTAMERKDWPYYALRYNGRRYKRNQYDTRLASADKKWERRLPALESAPATFEHPEEKLTPDQIKSVQLKLRQLGYAEVGQPNRVWGDKTAAAVFAFQKQEGLPATGHFDDATRAALDVASPRPAPEERATANVDDLRAAGSDTIAHADALDVIGKIKMIGGGTVGAAALAQQSTTALNGAQDVVDKAGQAKSIMGQAHDLLQPVLGHPAIIAIAIAVAVGGYFVIRFAERIRAARLADHQNGTHAGSMED
jgi:hypothetical protein